MKILELLQAGDSSIAIIGGVVAVALFLYRWRASAIKSGYLELAHTWTNEGDINGSEAIFVDLALQLTHGELFGSLTSPQFDESYDVYVRPGWFSSTACVTKLNGRNLVPIATVKLVLKGNNNRLHWKMLGSNATEIFPRITVLWPINVT